MMNARNVRELLLRVPLLRSVIVFALRMRIVLLAHRQIILEVGKWLWHSRETTNFTYDLTPLNKQYLASTVALVAGKPPEDIRAYIDEVDGDDELKRHIASRTANSVFRFVSDEDPKYARRVGWYAIVRAMKPRVVVETGIDKGLGSCVLTAALMRNKKEGYTGYYYGTDINPEAGWLLTGRYLEFGKILFGDSIASLSNLQVKIDLFINDSAHSAEYEEKEYQTVADKLSEDAIILGDNSHCTDKLLKFAEATGRQFLFFAEQPYHHWYPGGGIGMAYGKTR